ITVTRDGEIIFDGVTNQATDLDAMRGGILTTATPGLPFRVQPESGADPKLVERVREMFRVQLPTNDIANLTGTDNPTVVAAVNFRGQCFFDNRPITDSQLKEELRQRAREATALSKKLTFVVWADKAAANEVIMRLGRLA